MVRSVGFVQGKPRVFLKKVQKHGNYSENSEAGWVVIVERVVSFWCPLYQELIRKN